MTRVTFPARCAVSVICGEHLVSQVYPASVPVEVFIDSIVELLDDDLKRRGAPGLDPAVCFELQKPNGARLDVTKTLDELGVEDGATLILAPADEGDSFEPQYEALSTGLARVGKTLFAPVTPETAVSTAIAILGIAVLTIAALCAYIRIHTESWVPTALTGLLGLGIAFGAFAVWRWWPERTELLSGLAWLAVPPVAVSFAAAAPSGVGGAHLFIAALTTGVLSVGIAALTQRHITPAAITATLCGIGGLVAAARMVQPVPAQWLGMCVLIGLLLLSTLAPTIALRAARIRPPHFGSVTGRDLFWRPDGMPADAVSPVEDDTDAEPNPDTTASGAAITEAAMRAHGVLTGICVAIAVVLPVAVWATLTPGYSRGNAAAFLALLFLLIFISRARAFTARRQAVPLVCGAAMALCAAVTRYVIASDGTSVAALVWGAAILAGFAAAGLAAALLVPVTRFTPLVRMFTEWLELIAIVIALPLAAWIGGLFTWVRMR